MSNIHANLIKNATETQKHLMEFSHQMQHLSLKSLDNQADFELTAFNVANPASPVITIGGDAITVTLTNGVPTNASGASATQAQLTVAKAMAVVGLNLLGVGLSNPELVEFFKKGITPTSLAAAESQLKGHHDAVLQLSLESLSRVAQILQKIAQKLAS
jgi:hypothetical protein